jgi:hypothetical protein
VAAAIKENNSTNNPTKRVGGENTSIPRILIKEIIKTAVRKALPAAAAAAAGSLAPTWAAVAARATGPAAGPAANPAVKEVPARQEREVVIQARNQSADLANRTAKEVMAAVQAAAGRKGPIAARRLRSSNTVITFLQDAREGFL